MAVDLSSSILQMFEAAITCRVSSLVYVARCKRFGNLLYVAEKLAGGVVGWMDGGSGTEHVDLLVDLRVQRRTGTSYYF